MYQKQLFNLKMIIQFTILKIRNKFKFVNFKILQLIFIQPLKNKLKIQLSTTRSQSMCSIHDCTTFLYSKRIITYCILYLKFRYIFVEYTGIMKSSARAARIEIYRHSRLFNCGNTHIGDYRHVLIL